MMQHSINASHCLLSIAFLFPDVPSFTMSSCHLLLGHLLDLFPLPGYHSEQRVAHLLSLILTLCPAHFHFCFSVYSMMSIIFVLFLISEHGTSSYNFEFNIFPSLLFKLFLVLSVVYLDTMFGSHRSLLVRHAWPLLVFCVTWGVIYLEISPFFFFFFVQNSSMLLWS